MKLLANTLSLHKWGARGRRASRTEAAPHQWRVSKARRTKRRYLAWVRRLALLGSAQIALYRRIPHKSMSRLWGKFNQVDLPVFLRRPLIGLYAWLFGCDLTEAQVPDISSYRNLGEFFRRKLRDGVRPVDNSHVLTSPADGKVLYHGLVRDGILEQVKGVTYSLRGFLGPQTWDTSHMQHAQQAQQPSTSTAADLTDMTYQASLRLQPGNELHHVIIYLAPGDYHRFHSPANWQVHHRRHFPGELLSVNPGVARWIAGLFNFNERAVYSGQWEHGYFSMTAVGATNVGSIKIYCDQELETNVPGQHPKKQAHYDKAFPHPVSVSKGEMFGEFNLGSTIVLIFEAPRDFTFKVKEGDKIKFGEPLGADRSFVQLDPQQIQPVRDYRSSSVTSLH